MPPGGDVRKQKLRFTVAIPIPSQDRAGQPLGKEKIEDWTLRCVEILTNCFGGATPLPCPSRNRVGDTIIVEKGQMLVMSACRSREEFRASEVRIVKFAREMKEALNQYAVIVLAFPSDTFLVVDQA